MPAVFECRDNGRVLRLHNDSAFKLIWWRQIMAIMLQDIWNIENLEDYKGKRSADPTFHSLSC